MIVLILLLVVFLFLGAEVKIKSSLSHLDEEALSTPIKCFDQSLHGLVLYVDDEEVILFPSGDHKGESFRIIEWEKSGVSHHHSV